MENANVVKNSIKITREVIHAHWQKTCIFIDLPDGWNTLEPLTSKVLEYKGKNFVFLAWNSDRNEAWWIESDQTAKIK